MTGTVTLLDAARRAMQSGEGVSPPTVPPASGLVYPEPYPVYRPRDVLPHPKDLDCMVAWDTETSDLYVDNGGRIAVISVAFSLKSDPDTVYAYAFPFDQGRAKDKGFEPDLDKRRMLKVDVALADKTKGSNLVSWDGVHVPRGFRAVEVVERGVPRRFLQVDRESWTRDANLPEADWRDMLRWLVLAGEYVGLVGQNDKFDLLMTDAGTRHWPGVWLEPYVAWDTMLGSKILWPLESTSLKPTMAREFGAEMAEEAREVREALMVLKRVYKLTSDDGPRYDLLPWDINGPYATQDARGTLMLAKRQTTMFVEGMGDILEVDEQLDLMRVLSRMERRGFGPLDVSRAQTVATAIEARIAQLENAVPYDPPTAYKAKEYFFDDLGLQPWRGGEEARHVEYYTNKKGGQSKRVVKQGSLSVDVCNRMASQGVPFAAETGELLRLRTANTMNYRGYINLRGPDDRLRTTFRQVFVKSGRMSVERFQAQAIPRRDSVKIAQIPGYEGPVPHPRDLFLVPPGRRRATIDLSQAELRVAFKYSGCQRGIEQIEAGRDIHGEMATQIFHVQPGSDEFSHFRYISKRGVFGGIFMVGPKTFRETIWKLAQLWLPWDVCKLTIDGFRALYPEIEVAYNDSMNFAEINGYVELVGGVKSWFSPNDFVNTAWNRKVQGSLARFNAHWLTEVERRTADQDALVLTVHDSVTLDLLEDSAEEIVADIQDWTAREFENWFGIVGSTDLDWGF